MEAVSGIDINSGFQATNRLLGRNIMEICDGNCNNCPIILHPNKRMVDLILNQAYEKFGGDFYHIVQKNCPNMTCCFDCGIDDFSHIQGCELIERI